MTQIKYNDLEIKKITLGKVLPHKEKGIFIPIHGPKTNGNRIDPILFQTPLLLNSKAKVPEKNTQMMLSLNNIESIILSNIIENKINIFTKKVPSDNVLKSNFKSLLNSKTNEINFPFDLPHGENIVLFGIRGVILQGKSIYLDISLINLVTVNSGKPLETLGDSSDSDSGNSDNSSIISQSFDFN